MKKLEEIGALVLAAGRGTRMKSPIPKVLQPLLEEPLLGYPLAALSAAGISDMGVIVGHGAEEVKAFLNSAWPGVTALPQSEQKGTGDAVQISRKWWEKYETLVVLPGDAPLLTREAIEASPRKTQDVQKGGKLSQFRG